MGRRSKVHRFNRKKTYAGRTVKRTVLETRGVNKKRKERTLRAKRPVRSY